MPGLSITGEATAGNVHQKTGPAPAQPRPFSQMFHAQLFPEKSASKEMQLHQRTGQPASFFVIVRFTRGKNDPVQRLIVAMNEFSSIRLSTLHSDVGRWGRAMYCLVLYLNFVPL